MSRLIKAIPIACTAIGIRRTPIPLRWTSAGVWLVVAITLSTLASFWLARNATRLTVRDVLVYE